MVGGWVHFQLIWIFRWLIRIFRSHFFLKMHFLNFSKDKVTSNVFHLTVAHFPRSHLRELVPTWGLSHQSIPITADLLLETKFHTSVIADGTFIYMYAPPPETVECAIIVMICFGHSRLGIIKAWGFRKSTFSLPCYATSSQFDDRLKHGMVC